MRNVVVSGGAINMNRGAGVVTQFNPGNLEGAGCVLGRDPTDTAAFMLVEVMGGQVTRYDSLVGVSAQDGDLSIRRRQGQIYTCRRMTPPDELETSVPVPMAPSPHVALYVRGTSASFDWLLVVEGPAI